MGGRLDHPLHVLGKQIPQLFQIFAFLAHLHLHTGDPAFLATAEKILEFVGCCDDDVRNNIVAHKVMWGASLVGAITVAAVLGSLAGTRLVDRIPADALRRGFGWFVLAMGAFVLVQQAPDAIRVPGLLVLAAVAVSMAGCAAWVASCPLRRVGRPGAA